MKDEQKIFRAWRVVCALIQGRSMYKDLEGGQSGDWQPQSQFPSVNMRHKGKGGMGVWRDTWRPE